MVFAVQEHHGEGGEEALFLAEEACNGQRLGMALTSGDCRDRSAL